MKKEIIQAQIDLLTSLERKAYGIQIESSFCGIVELKEIQNIIQELYIKLQEIEDDKFD